MERHGPARARGLHFIDRCRLLGEKAPTDADPKGEWYAFEKGAMKTGGGDGWADGCGRLHPDPRGR